MIRINKSKDLSFHPVVKKKNSRSQTLQSQIHINQTGILFVLAQKTTNFSEFYFSDGSYQEKKKVN